jgi:hypothetical protein
MEDRMGIQFLSVSRIPPMSAMLVKASVPFRIWPPQSFAWHGAMTGYWSPRQPGPKTYAQDPRNFSVTVSWSGQGVAPVDSGIRNGPCDDHVAHVTSSGAAGVAT